MARLTIVFGLSIGLFVLGLAEVEPAAASLILVEDLPATLIAPYGAVGSTDASTDSSKDRNSSPSRVSDDVVPDSTLAGFILTEPPSSDLEAPLVVNLRDKLAPRIITNSRARAANAADASIGRPAPSGAATAQPVEQRSVPPGNKQAAQPNTAQPKTTAPQVQRVSRRLLNLHNVLLSLEDDVAILGLEIGTVQAINHYHAISLTDDPAGTGLGSRDRYQAISLDGNPADTGFQGNASVATAGAGAAPPPIVLSRQPPGEISGLFDYLASWERFLASRDALPYYVALLFVYIAFEAVRKLVRVLL